MKPADRKALIGIAAASLTGMLLIFFSTSHGPGVGGDATIYITSAQNLLNGIGLGLVEPDGSFRLLPYSAPFFPLVLAFLKSLGLEMVSAARFLNMVLFGGVILLAGGSLRSVTRSAWISIGGASLLAFSPILTPVFSWAMAEPLTLMAGFGGMWLMVKAVEQPGKTRLLVLSAVLTGLALLTRYSGAAFVAAAGLGWLLFADFPLRKKLLRGLVFGMSAILPMLAWVLVQLSYTSGVASRSIEDAGAMAGRLATFWPQFGEVLLSWLLPASWINAPAYPHLINTLMTCGMAIVLVGLGVSFFRHGKANETAKPMQSTWPALVSIFILIYTGVIFITYLTTYPPITLDNRMFSPIHTGVLMLLLTFLWSTGRRLLSEKSRWVILLPGLILAVFVLWYGWRDVRIVLRNFREGLGYNSLAWRSSELIAWVKKSPPDTKLVTNETMAVLYLTGRTTYPLAEIYADRPGDLNARYGSSSTDPGQAAFSQGEVPLVLFDTIASQFESIYGERTAQRVEALVGGLDQVFNGEDGAVYISLK